MMSDKRGACALVMLVAAMALPAAAADSKKAAPAKAASDALALVDGVAITAADVEQRAAGQLSQVRAQEHQILERTLEDLIADKLVQKEATSKGLSVNEYLRIEVDTKITAVTEEEKKSTYERFKSRLQGRSEEEGLKMIEDGLRQQRIDERRQVLLRELRAKATVRMLLEPPRTAVNAGTGNPSRGPANAPITIIEFSDFQCPFCSKGKATVDDVLARYGQNVHLVFRDFPLPFHKDAPKAAEAGQCAHEQGKFWELHDKMFANQAALGVDGLKKSAVEIGLDAAKFNECLDSNKYAEDWKKDTEAGQAWGVNGTPAFFINGRLLSGAQPLEAFTKIIDDELQRKGLPLPVAKAEGPKPEAAKAN
jgi:predicted DsbA family dithiol-disulfide isomerase